MTFYQEKGAKNHLNFAVEGIEKSLFYTIDKQAQKYLLKNATETKQLKLIQFTKRPEDVTPCDGKILSKW